MVVESFRRDQLVGAKAEVVDTWHALLERAYPIPAKERDDALASLLPCLQDKRIFSRGRLGGWKYEVGNQDHCFMQGVELASSLVLGDPEVTYFNPARANSGEFLDRKGY